MFLEDANGEFSFWIGEPVRYIEARFLSMIPPATGILVGDGVRGEELSFNVFRPSGDIGELPPTVTAAIKLLRSERELLLFFFKDLALAFVSSGGGEAPIGLSRDIGPLELDGRSSNAPRTVGLSREPGRLPGDSIDLERMFDPFDRLEEGIGSPVAALLLVLLNVRHTEGRSLSLVLFCRSIVSANLLRKDDVFDATEPWAE